MWRCIIYNNNLCGGGVCVCVLSHVVEVVVESYYSSYLLQRCTILLLS